MTSYFNTTIGQREQLDRLFDRAGLSREDVKRILANPTLADKMVATLKTQPLGFLSVSVQEQVEQQLNAWKNLGVAISEEQQEQILQQADVFEPFTDTDEPLVTGGFGYDRPTALVKKLFKAFTPPEGYAKYSDIYVEGLRYAPGMKPTGGLRLVHYDPNAYPKLSALDARKAAKKDGVRLAGIEVYEHLMLEPNAGLTLDGQLYYYPNVSGLERKYNGGWLLSTYLWRSEDRRFFMFDSRWAVDADDMWASPVVREC